MTKILIMAAFVAMIGVSACGVKGPLEAPSRMGFASGLDGDWSANTN
jgi:predicted small lipoprotein YifL